MIFIRGLISGIILGLMSGLLFNWGLTDWEWHLWIIGWATILSLTPKN